MKQWSTVSGRTGNLANAVGLEMGKNVALLNSDEGNTSISIHTLTFVEKVAFCFDKSLVLGNLLSLKRRVELIYQCFDHGYQLRIH